MDAENLPDYTNRPQNTEILNLRAMAQMAYDDPGMKDLLDRAKEYYALKGSPSLREVLKSQGKISDYARDV